MRGVSIRSSAKIRARAIALRESHAPGLEMSSLVDVAFLLLTFFILTSTLDPREADLGLSLTPQVPKGLTEPIYVVTQDPTRIRIAADGVVWCNDEAVATDVRSRHLPGLLTQLRTIKAAEVAMAYGRGLSDGLKVEVSADDQVSGQRFVDVMNCLAEAGIDSVALEGFRE